MQTYMKSTIEKERDTGDNQDEIEVLSREVTLKHVMILESAKINLQKQILPQVMAGKLPMQNMQQIAELEKQKSID